MGRTAGKEPRCKLNTPPVDKVWRMFTPLAGQPATLALSFGLERSQAMAQGPLARTLIRHPHNRIGHRGARDRLRQASEGVDTVNTAKSRPPVESHPALKAADCSNSGCRPLRTHPTEQNCLEGLRQVAGSEQL